MDWATDRQDGIHFITGLAGNNPKRQSIYGTTLALLTSQLFKQINNPGKWHSGVLIDELPTIYLKGLDNLIDTGRQNKVATVIGAQDRSQLVRDYDKKESDVIFNTVGNLFAGAVKGDTAAELSKSFGKEDREQRSYQEGDHQTIRHIPISYGSYCLRIRLRLCHRDISAAMLPTHLSNTCTQRRSVVKCRQETR